MTPAAARAGHRRALRALLAWAAVYAAGIGVYAVFEPHAFYRNVVGVDLLGAYNQHLLSDVGGFYLGFALLFAWASKTLGRELARAAAIAFTLTQAIHFSYHLAHLQSFTIAQAVAQTGALLPLLLLPIAVLIVTGDKER